MDLENYIYFKDQIGKISTLYSRWHKDNSIIVPIGRCSDKYDSNYSYLPLTYEVGGNIFLGGSERTGKSNVLNEMLVSMLLIYGEDLRVSYVDGKDCDVNLWLRDGKCAIPNQGFIGSVDNTNFLSKAIDILIREVENKRSRKQKQIIILNEVWYLIMRMSGEHCSKVVKLFREARRDFVPIIFVVTEHMSNIWMCQDDFPYAGIADEILDFRYTALTYASDEDAIGMQDKLSVARGPQYGKLFVYEEGHGLSEYFIPRINNDYIENIAELRAKVQGKTF